MTWRWRRGQRRARMLGVVALLVVVAALVAPRSADEMVLRTVSVGKSPAPAIGAGMVAVDDRAAHTFVLDSGENSVSMLDTITGALVRTIAVGRGPDLIGVDARTSRAFVINGLDGTASVLDTRGGAVLNTVPVGTGPIAVVVDEATGRVFSVNSGAYNSGADNGVVAVLDARSGRLVRAIPIGVSPGAAALDTAHALLVVVAASPTVEGLGEVYVLDAGSGAVVHTITIGQTPAPIVDAAALAVDGRTGRAAVVDGGSNAVSLLDVRRGRLLRTVTVGWSPLAVALDGTPQAATPAGRAFVVDDQSGSVSMLDLASGRVVRTVAVGANPGAAVVDPRAGRVAVLSSRGLCLLDAHSGALLRIVSVGSNPLDVVVVDGSPRDGAAGDRAFVTARGAANGGGDPAGPGRVSVVDVRTGAVVRTESVGIAPAIMAVDARAHRIVVLDAGGAVSQRGAGWIPRWLAALVPALPRTPRTRTMPLSVSILDAARVGSSE